MSNLDGVVGDARKRIEPAWVAGMESHYQPCHCGLHAALRQLQAQDQTLHASMVARGLIRLAELPSSDPT